MLDAPSIVDVLGTHLLQGLTFIHLLDRGLQVLEAEDEHRDVVERATCCTLPQHDLDSLRRSDMLIIVKLLLGSAPVHLALLAAMSWVVWRQVIRCLRSDLLLNTAPDSIHALLVVKSFENSIASYHEEIKVVFQFETSDFRITNDNVLVASVLLLLSFDITEGSRDGEAAWEDSQWTLYV